MGKSLRIIALAALLALGALKLAQYWAAHAQIERVAVALAPSLKLGYAKVGSSLDGAVTIEEPRLEVLAGPARGTVLRATRATVVPDGVLWLVARAVSGTASAPSELALRLEGASLTQPFLDRIGAEGWFGAGSLVPFDSLGCGTLAALAPRDYARMGIAARPREDEIRYRYDAAQHTLRLDLVANGAPFATVSAHLDLSEFKPSAWFGDARAAAAQRIEQLSLTYADGGYLAKRNRYCAQLAGADAVPYATRHVDAVKAFLAARGIAPGEEVEALYRKLVADGGNAELSILPDASFVPADYAEYPPEDLLRLLNVTLRRDTAPPILMRLAFTAPPAPVPEASAVAAAGSAASQGAVAETMPPASSPAADAPPGPTVETGSVPLMSAAYAAPAPVPAAAPAVVPPASEVLAVARPPEPPPATSMSERPSADPRTSSVAIPASAPPPPPNSTAALVWRAPTIERLPQQRAAEPSDFVAVAPAALASYIGSRVRLSTAGGKRVEGRLRQVDAGDAVLLVRRDGGTAEMRIPRAGIRSAELYRPRLSAE